MELLQRPAFSPMEPMAASCPDWLATHLHQAGGAVPFSTFMDLALNDPEHGYYGAGRARIGTQGDFVTSPSLGGDFAALLAPQLLTWLASVPTRDPDQPLSIVEIGPGDGHLALDLISQMRGSDSELLTRIELVLVEANPGMRERQQTLLQQTDDLPVRWCSLDQLRHAPVHGVVIAHELLDALPVERLIWREGSLQQQWVELAPKGDLRTTHRPLPDGLHQEIRRVCSQGGIQLPPPDAPEGWTTEWNSALPDWFAAVAAAVDAGVDVIDASCGGIGGCPFAPAATGNVATEDVVYMLERGGFETGLDLSKLIETAKWLETVLGHPIASSLSKAGGFPTT